MVQHVSPLPTDPYRRQGMTQNPDTTREEWQALIRDPVFSVRYAAATSPHVPSDCLSLMVVDAHPFVRAGVAHNPRTPERALQALAKDSDEHVAAAAQQNRAARQADDLSL